MHLSVPFFFFENVSFHLPCNITINKNIYTCKVLTQSDNCSVILKRFQFRIKRIDIKTFGKKYFENTLGEKCESSVLTMQVYKNKLPKLIHGLRCLKNHKNN